MFIMYTLGVIILLLFIIGAVLTIQVANKRSTKFVEKTVSEESTNQLKDTFELINPKSNEIFYFVPINVSIYDGIKEFMEECEENGVNKSEDISKYNHLLRTSDKSNLFEVIYQYSNGLKVTHKEMVDSLEEVDGLLSDLVGYLVSLGYDPKLSDLVSNAEATLTDSIYQHLILTNDLKNVELMSKKLLEQVTESYEAIYNEIATSGEEDTLSESSIRVIDKESAKIGKILSKYYITEDKIKNANSHNIVKINY